MLENLRGKQKRFLITGVLLAACLLVFLLLWGSLSGNKKIQKGTSTEVVHKEEQKEEGEGKDVALSPEALKAAHIETAEVTNHSLNATLRFTGSVEANQQQTQQITPLVGGRVERVNVALGDHVKAGQVLAVVSSPEVAEMHGILHEAETRLE